MAKKRVNRYPKAFRLMALERMKSCDNISELARELNVDRSVLYHWRDQLAGEGDGTTIKSPVRELRREIRDLKRVLAEKTLETDFFRGVSHGPSGPPIEMKMLATCPCSIELARAVRVV